MKKIILSIFLAFSSILVFSQATLPTSWSFPNSDLPNGWTTGGGWSDLNGFYTGSGNTPPAMKFSSTGHYLTINVNSNPGNLTYYLTGNQGSTDWTGTFSVEESDFGNDWTTLRTFTDPPIGNYIMFTDVPQSTTRYIRFFFTDKVAGNIGIDDVSIAIGAASSEAEINVTQEGETIISGSTNVINSPVSTPLSTGFMIENLGTSSSLNISSTSITGQNASDFTVISAPTSVAAGASDALLIEFTPYAGGTRYAVLTISSDDADEPSYIIYLYGIGGDLASEPSSPSLDIISSTSTTYSYTAEMVGQVIGYLVLRKKGSAITAVPTDGFVYQRGDVIGDAQVVQSSSELFISPNNIIAGTTYHFAIFAYSGPDNFRNYNMTPFIWNITTPATMLQAGYYDNLNTASPSFMNDLHALVNPHQQQFYSYYGNLMIPNFETRDTTLNRRVVTCVYSGENKIYTEPFSWSSTGYSREHSYCHSWMPTNPATNLPEYSDYHHLFPSNLNSANILRSNNPLGEVINQTSSFLACKSGTNSSGQTVFEPRDEHKGNAARAIMYQAICYNSVDGNDWALPAYQDQMTLKQWHFQDPPDNWEIARNDYIESLQGNRNPFVDSIDYVCFINFSDMTYDPLACLNTATNEILNQGFITYPNPSSDQLNIHVDRTTISSYKIIDYLGRTVLNKDTENSSLVKIDISKLKSGPYTIEATTPLGNVQKSLIVE
jgi:hypothetical protein